MNHHEYRELLSQFHDGELAEQEQQLLKNHLVGCQECASHLQAWSLIAGALRSIEGARLPSDFSRRVLRLVQEDDEETSLWMPVEALARRTVFGLSVAVIVLVALLLATEPRQPVIMESYLNGEIPEGTTPASLLQRESMSKDDVLLAVMQK